MARARLYKKRYFVIPPSTATLRLDDLNAVYFAIGQLVHQTHSYTHHATCFKGYANSQWATRDRACRMRMPAWTVERTRLDNGTDVVYMMQHLDVWVVPTLKALASGVPGNSDAKYVVTGSLAGNNLLYYMFKYATKVHDKNQTNNLDTLVAALLRQRRSQVQRGLPRDADAAAAAPRATVSSTAAAVVINAATRIAGMVEFDLPLVHFCLLNGSSRGTFVTSHPAMVKLGLRAAVFNRWGPRAGSDRAADDDAEVVTRLRPDEALRLYHNDSPLGQYAYRPAIHDALSAGRFHDTKRWSFGCLAGPTTSPTPTTTTPTTTTPAASTSTPAATTTSLLGTSTWRGPSPTSPRGRGTRGFCAATRSATCAPSRTGPTTSTPSSWTCRPVRASPTS